ncbi:MAG: diaminopimelate decarboxylase, partial [Dehalococcoidia bacterium]|nr:diaminopimelate decarboxylase [Dehalococcoidia bacterium]
LDTKFGFPLGTGQAEEAIVRALRAPGIDLAGLHFHLGSPIFETEPYVEAVQIVSEFAAEMQRKHGFVTRHLSPGGGFPIQYVDVQPAPPVADYAEAITRALRESWDTSLMPLPRLSIEPGRAIVGRAGVAIYKVGATKDIPGVRRYISVDGGMTDNIRPTLYGARYEATLANRPPGETATVTVSGKYCESGDILIKDLVITEPRGGDLIAIPASGAYCLPMSSNYNAATRPAVVFASGGERRLVRRRETVADLLAAEVGG